MSRITNNKNADYSRRQFLIGTTTAGLMMAFAPSVALADYTPASARLQNKQFNPTIWFEIDQTGAILVNVTWKIRWQQ